MDVVLSQLTSRAASVTTSPTRLIGKNVGARRNVLLTNVGSETVFYGSATVTVDSGTPLLAGAQISFECGAPIYAICATGPVDVRVLEVYPS